MREERDRREGEREKEKKKKKKQRHTDEEKEEMAITNIPFTAVQFSRSEQSEHLKAKRNNKRFFADAVVAFGRLSCENSVNYYLKSYALLKKKCSTVYIKKSSSGNKGDRTGKIKF